MYFCVTTYILVINTNLHNIISLRTSFEVRTCCLKHILCTFIKQSIKNGLSVFVTVSTCAYKTTHTFSSFSPIVYQIISVEARTCYSTHTFCTLIKQSIIVWVRVTTCTKTQTNTAFSAIVHWCPYVLLNTFFLYIKQSIIVCFRVTVHTQ